MINWKRKLTSRKLWFAVIGFVTDILIFCGLPESVIVQITAMIMAGATVIGYIVGEGLADSGTHQSVFIPTIEEDEEEEEKNTNFETTNVLNAQIMGLSTDTKPTTGVQPYSLFWELDTNGMYFFDGTQWQPIGGS